MKKIILISFTLFMMLFIACDRTPKTIIAQVNDEILTLEDFQKSMPQIEYDNLSKDKKRELINKWVELTLLAQKADSDELIKNNSIVTFKINNAVKKVKANSYINKHLQSIIVSDEELFNYYRLHRSDYKKKSISYRAQRIFFTDQNTMMSVKQKLDNKEILYTPAAMRYSEEGIGRNGGYMSETISEDGNFQEFYEVLNKLNKYEYTTMPYKNGYLIIRYYDTVEVVKDTSFEDAKNEIEQTIRNEKRNQIYKTMIKNIKSESKITITF